MWLRYITSHSLLNSVCAIFVFPNKYIIINRSHKFSCQVTAPVFFKGKLILYIIKVIKYCLYKVLWHVWSFWLSSAIYIFFSESCVLDSGCSEDNHHVERSTVLSRFSTGEMLLHLLSLATVKQRDVQQFRDAWLYVLK